MKNTQVLTTLLAIVTFCSLPVSGDSLEPLTVSPGATDRVTGVEVRCPTFSWQAVPGAVGYEVVVYELPPEVDLAAWSLEEAVEVLFVELPVGVTGWTPSFESGLIRGAHHVWYVRGVFEGGGGTATPWSQGRFFRVVGAVSVSGGGVQSRGGHGSSGEGEGEAETRSRGTKAKPGRKAITERVGEKSTKAEQGLVVAITGEVPDPSGPAYGMLGITSSPDGAGIAAASIGGGPDLVLDGAADGQSDTLIFQDGIDRPSGGIESFTFENSGGGDMNLEVIGTIHGNGSGLLDVDAETLDGIDSSAFSPLAHLHDDRYYTEGELNTSGGGGSVHWDNLGAVPPGFADGIDHDTTYAAGPGVIIHGDRILIDPVALSAYTQISTLDSAGTVGFFTSIAIGIDGLGLISYFDNTNDDLKVAHCIDVACTSATVATLDSAGEVGFHTSIAIGADGLGLISYFDDTNDELKVAHCADAACTSATIATLDSAGTVGWHTSIAIGADGLGLISYYDASNDDLKVAHCADAACTSAVVATLDSAGDVGFYTSIAIGADGLGLISYFDNTNLDLKVAHCADAACTSATVSTLDSAGNVGTHTSIAIGADGLGLISYHDASNADLKVAHCANTACTSATVSTLDSAGNVGTETSIAIGADGLGLVSYHDAASSDLKVAHCADAACTSVAVAILDSGGFTGYSTSIAIGAYGRGLISYYDSLIGDLKAAHLGIGVP